jgi:hypothetical protein
MSITDKLNGTQEDILETEVEIATAIETKEEKNLTLEQVIDSTGQNYSDDESKQPVKVIDDKDRLIGALKKELKQDRREVQELKGLVTDLARIVQTDKNQKISENKIQMFAEENGVDPDSIRKLANLIREEVAPQQETIVSQVKRQEDYQEDDSENEEYDNKKKYTTQRIASAAESMLNDFLQNVPEYKSVVDKDTITELILSNPNKYLTMKVGEIVEKVYGKFLEGKNGIERVSNQNRENKKVDFSKGATDREFESIKTNPEEMKAYKKSILERAQRSGLL